jgi:hypothetical protein
VKSKIVILLEQAAYISFTSDVWTSTNNLNAFISLTAHWIDSKWNRMSIVLSLRNLEDRHTGQVISDNILAMLAAWSIPDEKRGVLVRDNGASMKKAAELSGLDHLGCFIHTIQLVVKVGLLSQRSVMDAIVTARAIVGRFRHSTQATETIAQNPEVFDMRGQHTIPDTPSYPGCYNPLEFYVLHARAPHRTKESYCPLLSGK